MDRQCITHYTYMDSPIGPLTLGAVDGELALVCTGRLELGCRRGPNGLLEEARRQLEEYFAGARREFSLPLRLDGTDFQRQVWRGLMDIPCGETRTYSQLAEELGRPKARRAVGAACGNNPILIVVPCHRLVAKGGLGGFAAGLEAKAALLGLEKACIY